MIYKEATFSPDRLYRYVLTRHWDTGAGQCMWIGLTPSRSVEKVAQ